MEWNDTHTINTAHAYCYCGKDRSLLEIAIQCRSCRNWFHAQCTQIDHPPDLLFTTNYIFLCRNCNHTETYERTTAGWKDICSTAIANLILEQITQQTDEAQFMSQHSQWIDQWSPTFYFNKKQIIPYVDKHWKSLCTERARTTTWWATLGSCLYSAKDTFITLDEKQRSAASDFTLADPNLWHIRPPYDHKTLPTHRLLKRRESSSSHTDTPTSTPSPRSLSPMPSAVFPSGSNNIDHPFNRFGFKYTPCEPSVLPLIGYQQAENSLGGCTISIPDKSSYVSVTKDGLTVTTDKGFRMCRANVGVKEGNWFWEARIQNAAGSQTDGPHVRLGFTRREACLNAPVGYDAYGYGYRDKTGDRVFCARPEKYGEPFSTGDVIGLYISLPKQPVVKSVIRRRIPIAYKEHLWFEEKDFRPSKEMEQLADPYRKEDHVDCRVLPGSSITVYKNGVNQGVMFTDLFDYSDMCSLPQVVMSKRAKKKKKEEVHQHWTDDPPLEDDGTLGYYPSVSVFKGAVVTCNFGPQFYYPPQDQTDWKPYCQRYDEYMAEECVWDLLDEVSASFKKKHL